MDISFLIPWGLSVGLTYIHTSIRSLGDEIQTKKSYIFKLPPMVAVAKSLVLSPVHFWKNAYVRIALASVTKGIRILDVEISTDNFLTL